MRKNIWAHVNASIEDDVMDGRKCHLVFTDITKIKEAEAHLIKAKQLAEASEATQSQFLANMSHEIRTPLNGIMVTLQLLEMTSQTDEQKDYTRISIDSCKTLLSIINDILDYSKIDVGKVELEHISFEIRDVVGSIKKLFGPVSVKKEVSLDFEVASDVPNKLMGDPFRLKQIMSNLVGNAVKFTDAGYVKCAINLIEEYDNKVKLEMSVKDTGIGINKQEIFKSLR